MGLMETMATEGYHGSTIQRIARAAKLSPGLIHYHFQDKETILLALFEHIKQSLELRYERYLDTYQRSNPDPRMMAWHAIDAYIDAHLRVDPLDENAPKILRCWVQIGAQAIHHETIRTHYASHVQHDVDLLKTLIRLASPKMNAAMRDRAASGLYAVITGSYHLGVLTPGVIPEGDAASSARAIARALLAASNLSDASKS